MLASPGNTADWSGSVPLMIQQLTDQLAEQAVHVGAVKADDVALCAYSYRLLLTSVMTFVSLLIVGSLLRCTFAMALYTLSFLPLRIFSGGAHTRSYLSCYVSSLFFFPLIFLVGNVILDALPHTVSLVMHLGASVFIAVWAPVADVNKPLLACEKNRYRTVTHGILAVYLVAVFICPATITHSITLGILSNFTLILPSTFKHTPGGQAAN